MQVTVEELGACRRKLTIEVPAEKVTETFETVLAEYTQHATIKGFRPGKAPAKMVRNRFAKQIREEAKERLVPEGYRAAVKQESLVPVAVLGVEEDAFEPAKPFTFFVTCDVAPDFELPTYKKLKLNSERQDVTDSDVEDALNQFTDQFATFEDVDAAVQPGDLAQIDFEGHIGDQSIEDVAPKAKGLGKRKDFWMQAGPSAFLPEIGEAVIGKSAHDTFPVAVTFPEDFGDDALQGQAATFSVTVKRVREKLPGKLDDEKLKGLGVDSMDQLRALIQKDLEAQRERMETGALRNQLIGLLLEATQFELPESVVQDETRSTIYEMVQDIARRGTTEEQIHERKDELFDVASRSASDKVKVRYILARIAEAEEIKVTADEVSGRIAAMALQQQVSPRDLRSELQKRNQLANLEQDIRFEKTLDFLLKQADVTRTA